MASILSIAEMELEIARLCLIANEYRRLADTQAELANDYQAELTRRKADVFWEQHPGERLEVGDALLMTEDVYESEKGHILGAKIGNVYEYAEQVHDILINEFKDHVIIQLNGGHCPVHIDIARLMRKAWVAQRQGEALE